MEDAKEDESTAPSPVHAGITIGEARAHYMDMVLEEREAKFQRAQADEAYNLHPLDEHRCTDEQLVAGTAIVSDVDAAEKKALVDSYRTAREIRHNRWLSSSIKRIYKSPTRRWTRQQIRCSTRATSRRTSLAPPQPRSAVMTIKPARPRAPHVTRKSKAVEGPRQ